MRLTTPILAALVLAGCAIHPAPAASPIDAPLAPSAAAPGVSGTTAPLPARAPEDMAGQMTVTPAGAPVSGRISPSTTDVARRAIDIFGDSLILIPAPVLDSSAAEPSWDIDVRSYETQERVAHYVAQFSGRSRHEIAQSLERGSRYEPMIRAKMKAGGLPEDMYYLALVESGYNPNAYSRAAAVGMWQFMTSTARGMGMRVDWWVDERRDPVRSTTAAVRFIRGLRDQFGSLYLAAAAYNGGPGRVARGVAKYSDDLENTQQKEDAFFVLAEKDYLKSETREYVPQLIAAALVAKDPVRYGLDIHPKAAFTYDSVRVPGGTPLAAVAKAANATSAEIRELNPQILRGMTPPHSSYSIRIPFGSAAQFDSAFRRLTKEERTATRLVDSRRGDYADNLARKYGISESMLSAFNPHLRHLKPSGKLVPGQTLVIPSPAVAALASTVPDPSIERYPGSTRRIRVHTVKRGETVRLIARKYDTSSERIMKLNGLRKPMIFPGQSLIVSSRGEAGGKTKAGKSKSGGSKRKRSRSRG